jgi:hypothetical protein
VKTARSTPFIVLSRICMSLSAAPTCGGELREG